MLRFPYRLAVVGFVSLVLSWTASGCSRELEPPDAENTGRSPVIVIAVDGADGDVVRQLFDEGRLPVLRRISERGVFTDLNSLVPSKSPVVWTTAATGKLPEEHGITDFVIATPRGDVPVSTEARRVPAIWNMASASGLEVALVGWWPSWPAEEINGVVVTERVLYRNLDDRFWPPSFGSTLEPLIASLPDRPNLFPANPQASNDQLFFEIASELADDDFDLLLVYFRSVDVTSHRYWKYLRPPPGTDPSLEAPNRVQETEASEAEQRDPESEYGGQIEAAYEAIDTVVGEIMSRADPSSTVFVISDHGFTSLGQEKIRISFNLDRLLNHFGFLVYDETGVDTRNSKLYTFASPLHAPLKKVQFGGSATSNRESLTRDLARNLAKVSYDSGAPALQLRDPTATERAAGADLVVELSATRATSRIVIDGVPLEDVVTDFVSVSGGHPGNHPGVLFAFGPDIPPRGDLQIPGQEPGIQDVTPTLLYTLGLPVAEDFAGRAVVELFSPERRKRQELKSIPSWGPAVEQPVAATASGVDDRILQELRNLGYID